MNIVIVQHIKVIQKIIHRKLILQIDEYNHEDFPKKILYHQQSIKSRLMIQNDLNQQSMIQVRQLVSLVLEHGNNKNYQSYQLVLVNILKQVPYMKINHQLVFLVPHQRPLIQESVHKNLLHPQRLHNNRLQIKNSIMQ
jgi:hypothetical protein